MLYERGWKGCRAHHGPDGLEKGAARVRTSGLLKAKFIKHQSQQRGALQSEWCLVAPQGPGTPIPGSHGVRPADPRFYPKCIEGGWAWMRRAVGSSSSPGSFWEPIVLGGHSSRWAVPKTETLSGGARNHRRRKSLRSPLPTDGVGVPEGRGELAQPPSDPWAGLTGPWSLRRTAAGTLVFSGRCSPGGWCQAWEANARRTFLWAAGPLSTWAGCLLQGPDSIYNFSKYLPFTCKMGTTFLPSQACPVDRVE